MAERYEQMASMLVAGRDCGACTACCVVPAIDQPDLQKPAGQICPNCILGQGCTIYETRPLVCRRWFCAWRQLDWIGENLRPDQSDVLICPAEEEAPIGYDPSGGLDVVLLGKGGLGAPGLAEMLRHAIRANIAIFLCLPGEPGRGGTRMLLNVDLKEAAERGQSAILLRELKKAHLTMTVIGEGYAPSQSP
jgi:hypothetical protein